MFGFSVYFVGDISYRFYKYKQSDFWKRIIVKQIKCSLSVSEIISWEMRG